MIFWLLLLSTLSFAAGKNDAPSKVVVSGPSSRDGCESQFAEILGEMRNRDAVPLRRFFGPIDELRKISASAATFEENYQNLLKPSTRWHTFLLEALMRTYREHPKLGPTMEEWLPFIKQYEDMLGFTLDTRGALQRGRELKLPKSAIAQLERDAVVTEAEFKKYLAKSGWTSNPPRGKYRSMVEDLQGLDWPRQKKDKEFILDFLVRQIRDIEKTDFDMRDLQGGMHELRKRIRWVSIYLQSFEGKIHMTDEAVEGNHALNRFLADKEKLHKFLDNGSSQGVKHAIEIPRDLVGGLRLVGSQLGELKDKGEAVEFLEHALLEAAKRDGEKLSVEEAQRRVEKLLGKEYALEKQFKGAEKLYKELQESQLLKRVRKELEAQM